MAQSEMEQWWGRNPNIDLGEFTKAQVEDLTGCVPLLLDGAVENGKFVITAPALLEVEENTQMFFDEMCHELGDKCRDLEL